MREFGELEAVIMDRLWAWGRPTSVREMVDDLQNGRQIAYTTVMTAGAAALALVPLLLALTPAVVALALGRMQPM